MASRSANKPMKGSLGTSFIIEKIPGNKRLSCSTCINYGEDRSCVVKGTMIAEIGYDFWKQCDKFDLNSKYDTEENRLLALRVRTRIHNMNSVQNNKKKKKGKKKSSKSIKVTNVTTSKKIENTATRVISRLTVQQMKKKGKSYKDIANHFNVNQELIRKIDLGFYGTGYIK